MARDIARLQGVRDEDPPQSFSAAAETGGCPSAQADATVGAPASDFSSAAADATAGTTRASDFSSDAPAGADATAGTTRTTDFSSVARVTAAALPATDAGA